MKGGRALTDEQIANLVQRQMPKSMPLLQNPAAEARQQLLTDFKQKKSTDKMEHTRLELELELKRDAYFHNYVPSSDMNRYEVMRTHAL
jgi:hypothetical protein